MYILKKVFYVCLKKYFMRTLKEKKTFHVYFEKKMFYVYFEKIFYVYFEKMYTLKNSYIMQTRPSN